MKRIIDIFKDNKIIGSGPNTFRYECEDYSKTIEYWNGKAALKISCTTHPHNTYAQLLSETGIIGFSKSLALEYAKKNININCVSPGFIETQMTDKIDPKYKELIISKIPSARLGEPTDIANAVIFLASNQSDYINGETLHVNGGMYMA